jgi:hypothetical protein
MIADDSSMRTDETFEPTGCWLDAGAAGSDPSRLETAAADREPDTMPATTATDTIAQAPRPRRGPTGGGALGGLVDHDGALFTAGGP